MSVTYDTTTSIYTLSHSKGSPSRHLQLHWQIKIVCYYRSKLFVCATCK